MAALEQQLEVGAGAAAAWQHGGESSARKVQQHIGLTT